ncbi:monoglyceride lipase-like [Pristis pectinata]|nr:monoglyceride lipase-like [Pristis pectinata]
MVKQRYPRLPLFLLAQGLGGLVATYVGKERQHEIAGVIFMAPLVLVNPESATPLKLCCARMMYHLMPNFSLGYMDPRWLSRSQREVINYMNDPLNYLGPFRMRFIVQVLHAVTKLDKIFPEITWPVLILHGDSDKLCDIKGSFLMYEKLGSSDKTFKVIHFSQNRHL